MLVVLQVKIDKEMNQKSSEKLNELVTSFPNLKLGYLGDSRLSGSCNSSLIPFGCSATRLYSISEMRKRRYFYGIYWDS